MDKPRDLQQEIENYPRNILFIFDRLIREMGFDAAIVHDSDGVTVYLKNNNITELGQEDFRFTADNTFDAMADACIGISNKLTLIMEVEDLFSGPVQGGFIHE